MRCPFCAHESSDVKDSRIVEQGRVIKRRRQCQHCLARFNTFERIELRSLMVIKRNGMQEPFDRQKLKKSISLACRKRNISEEKLDNLITSMVRQLETSGDAELKTNQIGELAMRLLAELDKVAFVRYASVYKEFDEVSDFEQFITAEIKKT